MSNQKLLLLPLSFQMLLILLVPKAAVNLSLDHVLLVQQRAESLGVLVSGFAFGKHFPATVPALVLLQILLVPIPEVLLDTPFGYGPVSTLVGTLIRQACKSSRIFK